MLLKLLRFTKSIVFKRNKFRETRWYDRAANKGTLKFTACRYYFNECKTRKTKIKRNTGGYATVIISKTRRRRRPKPGVPVKCSRNGKTLTYSASIPRNLKNKKTRPTTTVKVIDDQVQLKTFNISYEIISRNRSRAKKKKYLHTNLNATETWNSFVGDP